ncbi:LytTR family DNA-binding domain-containing protein [Ruminococcaceae bacterium OttesenSCG-928-L11]|nr:LytTR family DNA-binding domain-containing protein [Ruminococcaceae bacterium OttesenSCG-928-L11]
MLKLAICDDDRGFLSELSESVARVAEEDGKDCLIDEYTSPSQLLAAIEKDGQHYDAFFLDILMEEGELDGIELAKRLRQMQIRSAIIFVTRAPEYALSSFDVGPVHYLLKPVTPARLSEALNRCVPYRQPAASYIYIEDGPRQKTRVSADDILYIEVIRTKLIVRCKGDRSVTGIGSLHSVISMLDTRRFYQCHRSFVVNLSMVTGIRRFEYVLPGGHTVPIAKKRYPEAMRAMITYKD